MINIELKESEKEFCFTVSGHAGYAPAGEDIVCAGVSSAMLFIASFVIVTEGRIVEMKPSYSQVILSKNELTELIAEAAKSAFETMTVRYGKYVNFSCVGV